MRGGIILSLMFFVMALAVLVVWVSPINEFLDMAQQSDNLNCKGFIYNGNASHALSFNNLSNGGQSGSPSACLTLKLFLPALFLIFLVGGISSVLAGKGDELLGINLDAGGGDGGY